MKNGVYLTYLIVLMLILEISGCGSGGSTPVMIEIGQLRTDNFTFDNDPVSERIAATLIMGAGECNITGGSANIAEGEFTYNVDAWKPIVTTSLNSFTAVVRLEHPPGARTDLYSDQVKYQWDLMFNNDLPMELNLDIGVGQHQLILGDLNLNNLVLNSGVGAVELDLLGSRKSDLIGDINCGVGELHIKLPNDAGIRVKIKTSIGSVEINGLIKDGEYYTNSLYEMPGFKIDLDIESGVGDFKIDVI